MYFSVHAYSVEAFRPLDSAVVKNNNKLSLSFVSKAPIKQLIDKRTNGQKVLPLTDGTQKLASTLLCCAVLCFGMVWFALLRSNTVSGSRYCWQLTGNGNGNDANSNHNHGIERERS